MVNDKISMKTFGITKEEIVDDLTKYYDKIYSNTRQKWKIEQEYESVEDYVNILYWIKFIKKMNYREMEELTGKLHFYQHYSTGTLFWHYDTDSLKKCEKMYKEELEMLQNKKIKAQDYLDKYMPEVYHNYIQNLTQKQDLSLLASHYGHNDVMIFIKEIYYLRFIEKFTVKEFSILYDRSTRTINNMLKKLSCNFTKQEAQENVVKRGRRNYSKAFITRRENHVKNILNSGLTGSNEENICRLMINDQLIKLIDSKDYEIVVGVSNRTIIAPYEIDIPLVIINKKTNKIIKYAVEYNGDVWHKDRKEMDKYKELKLNELGWKYFALEYHSNSGDITERFKQAINSFCEMLATEILL